jgi:hypothetical protein
VNAEQQRPRDFHAVTSPALGAIKRPIRSAKEQVGFPDFPADRDAEADSDMNLAPGGRDGFPAHALPKPFGLTQGFRRVTDIRRNNQELFTPKPAEGVVGSDGRTHSARGFAQDRIANQMPVSVVNFLEVVEVSHGDSDRNPGTLAARQFPFQRFEDGPPVPDAGQRVMGGFRPKSFTRQNKLLLQFHDAASGAQAGAQFGSIEGLSEVIIRAGVEARHNIVFLTLGSQQKDVRVSVS